jgi:hypothetical protein
MKNALLVLALLFTAPVFADEASKTAKIAELIKAQKLEEMMLESMEQSTAQLSDMGKRIFDQMLADTGQAVTHDARIDAVFRRFMERTAKLVTAKEYVDIWAGFYGKDLSEAELDAILAYYHSPAGKKDTQSAQAAMRQFGPAIAAEYEKRAAVPIKQMTTEMTEALQLLDAGKN